MKCKNCGVENKENTTFCKSCGTRIDGKITCKKCKQVMDDDNNAFCIHCGAKIKKKKSRKTAQNSNNPAKTTNFFKNLGFYLGLSTILLCLIFTFFVGVQNVVKESYSGTTDAYVIIDSVYSLKYSIFDFFDLSGYLEETYFLIANLVVMLTVVVFLIATAVSFIFSLRSFIKSTRDEKYLNKFIKWSLASYFIYIFFAVCFQQLFAHNLAYSMLLGQQSVYYRYEHFRLNDATIAGIVLTSIAMLVTLVSYNFYKFKGFNKQYIGNAIATILLLGIGAFGLGLLSAPIVNTYTFSSSISFSSEGIYFYLYQLGYVASNTSESIFIGQYIPTIITILCIVALTFAYMVVLILLIKDLLVDFGERKEKRVKVSSICLGIFLILISIAEFILLYFETTFFNETYTARYTLPIGILALGIVFILYTIISSTLLTANKSSEDIEQAKTVNE